MTQTETAIEDYAPLVIDSKHNMDVSLVGRLRRLFRVLVPKLLDSSSLRLV